jgi:hypothetical protein
LTKPAKFGIVNHKVKGEIMNKALGKAVLDHFLNDRKLEEGNKWRCVGRGYFGEAYLSDMFPDICVKVSLKPWDGWRAFAKWVFEGKVNSVHAPKIWAYKELPWTDMAEEQEALAIAVMERLVKFEDETVWSNPKVDYRKIKDSSYAHRDDIQWFGYGAIKGYCKKIAEALPDWKHDLHGNNIMIRPSTGEVVVTDPIAFHRDRDEYRLDWWKYMGNETPANI